MIPLLLALVLASAAEQGEPVLAAESVPQALPPAVGVERVALPEVQVYTLPGGAVLWQAPLPSASLVALELVLTVPPDLVREGMGQALQLLPAVIDAGAEGAPKGGLDAQLEPLGASVLLGAEDAGLRLRLLAPEERFEQALGIVVQALLAPACERRPLARLVVATNRAQERARYGSTGMVRRMERELLYPPGHLLAPRKPDGPMDRGSLLAQHERLLHRGGAVVVLTGPVGEAEGASVAGALAFLGPPPALPSLPPARRDTEQHAVWLLRNPGARQVVVSVSWPVPASLSWAEAQLVADLLGGGATARLDRRLRDELGLVYEARARLVREPGHAVLRVSTRMSQAEVVRAVAALRAELEGMATVAPDELQRARATRLFSVARELDGAEGSAATLGDLAVLGLDPAGRQQELNTLAGLGLDAATRAAHQLLDPEAATWVLSGSDEVLVELKGRAGLGPACDRTMAPDLTVTSCEED